MMKTLEKDRNRRYETAKDFAVDVQLYLDDEQVQACPPSAGYRLRKVYPPQSAAGACGESPVARPTRPWRRNSRGMMLSDLVVRRKCPLLARSARAHLRESIRRCEKVDNFFPAHGTTMCRPENVLLNGRAAKLADLKPGMTLRLQMAEGKSLVNEIRAITHPAQAQYVVDKVTRNSPTTQAT